MSKSLLIGAVRRVSPDIRSDVAKGIVESILDTISAELVNQGVFTLQKIGSLTLQQKPSRQTPVPVDDSPAGDTAGSEKRVPGIAARYHVSRFLSDKLRISVASRRSGAGSATPPG